MTEPFAEDGAQFEVDVSDRNALPQQLARSRKPLRLVGVYKSAHGPSLYRSDTLQGHREMNPRLLPIRGLCYAGIMLTSAEQQATTSAAAAIEPNADVSDDKKQIVELRQRIDQIEMAVMMRLNAVEARLTPLPEKAADLQRAEADKP